MTVHADGGTVPRHNIIVHVFAALLQGEYFVFGEIVHQRTHQPITIGPLLRILTTSFVGIRSEQKLSHFQYYK